MPPRRGPRSSLIDDEALLGSTDNRDLEYQHFSIDASDAPPAGSGVVGTMKGWWADDRKRKLIIGAAIAAVILLIIIIAIAAAASGRSRGGGTEIHSSSSSTGGGGGIPSAGSSTGGPAPSTGIIGSSTRMSSGGGGGGSSGSSASMSSGSGYSSSSSSSALPPPPPPDPEYPWLYPRLPTYILPTNYDLYEVINIDQRVFGGTVDITLNIAQPISHLVLHSVGLYHSSVTLTNNDGTAVPVVWWYYAANDYLVLNFTDTTVASQLSAKLSIAFWWHPER